MTPQNCSVCNSSETQLFKEVGTFSYYECLSCEVIFISQEILAKIDAGEGIIKYSETYWKEELYAAKERSCGSTLARVAELFLYARIPINKFVDIGSGPG
ncbi:MAG: hypothetical protein ABIR18_04975, partial [Chitinophagaceae bacterium]